MTPSPKWSKVWSKVKDPHVAQEPRVSCPPFTLHLLSSGDVPKQYGLDSVVVNYIFPQGEYYFSFWAQEKNTRHNQIYPRPPILYIGAATRYYTYQSKLDGDVYCGLHLNRLDIVGGYRVRATSHPSWFVGIRREWKLF